MLNQAMASTNTNEFPDISVIVLNWNGKRYLGRCLTALMQTTYPADRLKVILADNASQDGSPDWVRDRFPSIQVLENGKNLGFGAGNNRAIGANDAPCVALLNTDTAVHADWLTNLLQPLLADQAVGATTAKLLYMDHYLPLSLGSASFVPENEMNSADSRRLGVQVHAAQLGADSAEGERPVRLLAGFHAPERGAGGTVMQWTNGSAEIGAPVSDSAAQGQVLELTLSAWRPDQRAVQVSLACAGHVLYQGAVSGQAKRIRVAIPAILRKQAKPLLQSAGSAILPDGSGRDRGAVVVQGHVYPSWDDGRFDGSEEVFHFNGAACLLRRKMLESVGVFDERFFMYYEDMDLAWRARAQGWKIQYAPQAIVRHVHSGSAGEWSPLFTYNVDLNRLLMLMKNAPQDLVRQQLRRYAAETVGDAVRALGGLLTHPSVARGQLARNWIRLRVWLRLLVLAPGILRSRRLIQAGRTVPSKDLEHWLRNGGDQAGDKTPA